MNKPLGRQPLKCNNIFVLPFYCPASLPNNYICLTQTQGEPKADRDIQVLPKLKACCSMDYRDNVASGKGTYMLK